MADEQWVNNDTDQWRINDTDQWTIEDWVYTITSNIIFKTIPRTNLFKTAKRVKDFLALRRS